MPNDALANRMLTDAAKPWQSFVPTSSCCDKRIRAAMQRGELDKVDLWTCPACGCDWTPSMIGGIRVWEAHPIVQVFR